MDLDEIRREKAKLEKDTLTNPDASKEIEALSVMETFVSILVLKAIPNLLR
jgi:hypothetical protein